MRRERGEELKVCGRNAVRALVDRRPGDVQRVYLLASLAREFGPLLKRCAARRLPYRFVEEEELARVAESLHHEGICVVAKPPPVRPLPEFLAAVGEGPAVVAVLHGIGNPHNLGAILRVAAHFGVAGVLLAGRGAGLSTAACRMAEGGAEAVPLGVLGDDAGQYAALRGAGFTVFATAVRQAASLYATEVPPRVAVVFGPEAEGLPEAILGAADVRVTVPGSGAVESLNVSCAAAAVLGEISRRRGPPAGPDRESKGAGTGVPAPHRRRDPGGGRARR